MAIAYVHNYNYIIGANYSKQLHATIVAIATIIIIIGYIDNMHAAAGPNRQDDYINKIFSYIWSA